MNEYKKRAMNRLFGDAEPNNKMRENKLRKITNDATSEQIQAVPNRTQILQLLGIIDDRAGISKYVPESKTFMKCLEDFRKNYARAENLKDCKQLLNKMISVSKKPEFFLMMKGNVADPNSLERGAEVVQLALTKIKSLMK